PQARWHAAHVDDVECVELQSLDADAVLDRHLHDRHRSGWDELRIDHPQRHQPIASRTMRTSNASRSKSFTSRALLATLLAVVVSTSGRAPVRAQSTGGSTGAQFGQSATLLPDGRWLLIGGERTPGLVQIRGLDGTTVTLPVSPITPRARHTATVL